MNIFVFFACIESATTICRSQAPHGKNTTWSKNVWESKAIQLPTSEESFVSCIWPFQSLEHLEKNLRGIEILLLVETVKMWGVYGHLMERSQLIDIFRRTKCIVICTEIKFGRRIMVQYDFLISDYKLWKCSHMYIIMHMVKNDEKKKKRKKESDQKLFIIFLNTRRVWTLRKNSLSFSW